jgi:hypothetical protein
MPHRTPWRRIWLVTALVALLGAVVACGWALVLADRAAAQVFVLPGATDVRHERLSIGLQRVTFSYVGDERDEREWLRHSVLRRGYRRLIMLGDCVGRCRDMPASHAFTRRSLWGMMREVAHVTQSGSESYFVRVDLRRCIRLPVVGCWPR